VDDWPGIKEKVYRGDTFGFSIVDNPSIRAQDGYCPVPGSRPKVTK
jgi:hypothetical protein